MIDAAAASDVTKRKRWIKKPFRILAHSEAGRKHPSGAPSQVKMLCGVLLCLRHSCANHWHLEDTRIANLWYVALLFQIFDNEAKDLEREVCFIDIACDEIPERYYKESEVSNKWGWQMEETHSFIQQIFVK